MRAHFFLWGWHWRRVRGSTSASLERTATEAPLERAAEVLRPSAISAGASRRVKLEYANVLNDLSHVQPLSKGVAACVGRVFSLV